MVFMLFQGPGFELEVPTDWLVVSSPDYQAMFLGPKLKSGARANMMVTVRPVNEDVTLEVIAVQARKFQEHEYDDYHVLDETDYTQEGGIAYLRRYEWGSKQGGNRVSQVQGFFLVDNVLFTLTATRTEKKNKQVDAAFDRMFRSFRVKLLARE